MNTMELVKCVDSPCLNNFQINQECIIVIQTELPYVVYQQVQQFIGDSMLLINNLTMKSRRIHQSYKITEEPDSESSNFIEPKRSHSAQNLYRQIRGLRNSIKNLQALSFKNQGKIQSIGNLIKGSSETNTRRTLASSSDFSKQDHYGTQMGESRKKLRSLGRVHRMNGRYLKRASKQFQHTASNEQLEPSLRPQYFVREKRSEGIKKKNQSRANLQLQFDDNNIYGLHSSGYSNQASIKNAIDQHKLKSIPKTALQTREQKLDWVRENTIGFNTCYVSPFDLELQAVYVDHTATNRPFQTIESMVSYAKLQAANPHTEYSTFGKFSTGLMHYSQQSLLKSLKASPDKFIAIPTGSGSTGALKHSIEILKGLDMCKNKQSTTIFITPYEHHSNILPWVEMCQNVEVLVNDDKSSLVMGLVREQLMRNPSDFLVISVSAASNVTSKLTNLLELNSIIRQVKQKTGKAVVFSIDCAAFCCHHQLDVQQLDQLDFACISPHKNLGGAQTCGVLLMRKQLAGDKPSFPGGGTVQFVAGYSKSQISYDDDTFARQIAGTPPWFGFYRAALSFELLTNTIGYDFIHEQEKRNVALFFALVKENNLRLQEQDLNSMIKIYGQQNLDRRANVVSFNIVNQQGQTLIHHDHICAALADVFGIQVRSGCFCAGPYGIQLLNLHQEQLQQIKGKVSQGNQLRKPGFVRLDLTFYLKQFQVKYIAKAIYYLTKYIHNLQKLYQVDQKGKVTPKGSIKNGRSPLYELKHAYQLQEQVRFHNLANKNKLRDRKQTLQKQLRIGKSICRHPWDYIN